MDFLPDEESIATDKYELSKFDSEDFSSKLVHIHTGLEENEQQFSTPKKGNSVKVVGSEGTKLVPSPVKSNVSTSLTSFNKWYSQTALLEQLVEEASGSGKNNLPLLSKESFDLDGDAPKDDCFYNEYGLFFYKTNDGTWANRPVVSYLLSSFTSSKDERFVNLNESYFADFNDFKSRFMELLDRDKNEANFKRALLTLAFNHYGCSTVWKYMTLDEYLALLDVYSVFDSTEYAKFMFKSMDRKHKSLLTLNEFLAGMASCSPECSPSLESSSGKLRLQHIFRAYDVNLLGYLNQDSLGEMVKDLKNLTGESDPAYADLPEKLLMTFNGSLSYDSFYNAVENNLLKNTHLLFRSSRDLAVMVKEFLLNSVNHVLVNEGFKTPSSFGSPQSDSKFSDVKPSPDSLLKRFTFGNQSPRDDPQEGLSYSKPKSPGEARRSVWSHTPRVYSEFTHDKGPLLEPMQSFSHMNSWSDQKTQSQIERISKLYYFDEDNATPKTAKSPSPTKASSPEVLMTPESDGFLEGTKPKGLSEANKVTQGETGDDVFLDALDEKPNFSETGNKNLDALIKEYQLPSQTPPKSSTNHKTSLWTNYPNTRDVDTFKGVLEDESQFLSHHKEPLETFTPFKNSNDMATVEESLKLVSDEETGFERFDEGSMGKKVGHCVPKDDDYSRLRSLDEFLDQDFEEDFLKAPDHSVGKPVELSTSPVSTDQVRDPKPEEQVKAAPPVRVPVDHETVEAMSEGVLRRYTSKFLVFKGLLIDNSIARSVFRNFLEHSLGDSRDFGTLKLCTFSDMLQLCDSVVSLLRKEDSLLELRGDFTVYGSLNGDLSCLLDMFNSSGWPMMKKKSLDELSLTGKLNFKNQNWVDLEHSHVFMGGFVSGSTPLSLEFVMLLFSLKVMFPYHVYFVRSKKDERKTTNNLGLYDEIYRKLSSNHETFKVFDDETFFLQCAKELFHRINDVFEFFSVAAVLNDEILVVDSLPKGLSQSNLVNLPKPLTFTTVSQDPVRELLFRRSSTGFSMKRSSTSFSEEGGSAFQSTREFNVPASSLDETQWDLGECSKFNLVVCSSDDLDGGFKYLLNNKLLLLSTNFNKKKEEKVATTLVVNKKKLTHRSLRL